MGLVASITIVLNRKVLRWLQYSNYDMLVNSFPIDINNNYHFQAFTMARLLRATLEFNNDDFSPD